MPVTFPAHNVHVERRDMQRRKVRTSLVGYYIDHCFFRRQKLERVGKSVEDVYSKWENLSKLEKMHRVMELLKASMVNQKFQLL